MKRGYSIIDHPSDLGIEARGNSLSEAFEEAARALIAVIVDPSSVQTIESRSVRIAAQDKEQLLVRWLSEILYLYDGNHFAGKVFHIHELTTNEIRADILGEEFSPGRHRTRIDVKAITYHQISVTESSRGATLRVFLDI
jgi:SHS2 domain-containing protein